MGSFKRRAAEYSSENYRQIVELLHDSPSWPDAAVLDELHCMKRYLADIKFEVHRIESLVDGRSATADPVEETQKGSEDGSNLAKDLALNFIDDALNLPFWVTPLVEEALRRAQDEEAAQNPVFSGVLKILDLSFNPEHVIPRLRHYIVTGKLNRLTSQLGTVENRLSELGSMLGRSNGQMSAIQQDISDLRKELVEQTSKLSEYFHEVSTLLNTNQQLVEDVLTKIDSISGVLLDGMRQLFDNISDLSQKVTHWGEAVYNKIVECCVKDDVAQVINDVSYLKGEVSDIKNIVSGGEPASTRNTSGAILAAIKSVQAELSIIRGYL